MSPGLLVSRWLSRCSDAIGVESSVSLPSPRLGSLRQTGALGWVLSKVRLENTRFFHVFPCWVASSHAGFGCGQWLWKKTPITYLCFFGVGIAWAQPSWFAGLIRLITSNVGGARRTPMRKVPADDVCSAATERKSLACPPHKRLGSSWKCRSSESFWSLDFV